MKLFLEYLARDGLLLFEPDWGLGFEVGVGQRPKIRVEVRRLDLIVHLLKYYTIRDNISFARGLV